MAPDSSQVAPSRATSKGTKKGSKGGKKQQKRRPQWVIVDAGCNNDDKEEDGSDKGYVTTVEHDFKGQAHQPKDNFEILGTKVFNICMYISTQKMRKRKDDKQDG
jgi:hypothetical protein